MSAKTMASARVQVTLEIPTGDAWGDSCTVDQIYKQAKESALGKIRRLLEEGGARVIGEPHVIAIVAEKER